MKLVNRTDEDDYARRHQLLDSSQQGELTTAIRDVDNWKACSLKGTSDKALHAKILREEISMTVSWSDDGWWLLSIGLFHCGLIFAILSSRDRPQTLVALGSCFIVIIAASDALNYVIIESQEIFASRAYFDTSGVFTNILITIPFLLHSLLVLSLLIVSLIVNVHKYI